MKIKHKIIKMDHGFLKIVIQFKKKKKKKKGQ
jgi:hypothetical protein